MTSGDRNLGGVCLIVYAVIFFFGAKSHKHDKPVHFMSQESQDSDAITRRLRKLDREVQKLDEMYSRRTTFEENRNRTERVLRSSIVSRLNKIHRNAEEVDDREKAINSKFEQLEKEIE